MNRKTKILVVENEMPLAMLMVHVLTRVGCDVQVVNSGGKAMALAKETRFDLIALDMDIGRQDASNLDICTELKQRHISRNTPVLLISAKPCESDIQEGMKRGAADYIVKPFDLTDFIYRVILHAKIKVNQPTKVVMGAAA